MTNLSKLEFMALDISRKNYLSWIIDAEIHLDAMGIGNTIETVNALNEASNQDKTKVMIFLCHHLNKRLKVEYLTVKDPTYLWNNLNENNGHQKTVVLPRARFDWLHLRLQDFKYVSEYNSAMFKITSQLKLCGETIIDEDMLEKTFTIFHTTNMLMQQQYREKCFKKYSELISCLLVAEQNNELLMKNHQSRLIGSSTFPEVNASSYNHNGRGSNRGRGHGGGCHNHRPNNNNDTSNHQKWENNKSPHPNDKNGQSDCHGQD
ncbi:hypothetical protein L2E82_14216 [Cichorium intybus]|uniref:Uncharacterized protein n=1 Tax=Cichorium intybus TaxID=13427 RepID=A0ACB9EZF2_CICIN|nr:hypothetical protein L2E82_14216 [Cichorium intybus]